MNARPVPTVPSYPGEVGTEKSLVNERCPDCPERPDHSGEGEGKKKGSLRALVGRWLGEADADSERSCDVLPSSSPPFVFLSPLSPGVGTVGTVGTGPSNLAFGCPDPSIAESGQSGQWSSVWTEGEPEQWLNPDRELTWADVPSEATVTGLLVGYQLRPRKA